MQAAGLTSAVIGSLAIDSLGRLVGYHILSGAVDEISLDKSSLPLKVPTLFEVPPSPPVYDNNQPLQQGYSLPIFIKHYPGHGLYANDQLVGGEAPVATLNGYLYAVDKVVLASFNHSVYDFLQSQPDLSLYVAALKIVDSINAGVGNTNYEVPGDTLIFRRQGVFSANRINTYWFSPNCFTIFAPVNAAFEAAGFHTVDDIRKFAVISGSSFTRQSPMDSVLRRHIVFDRYNSNSLKTILLYSDLQYNSVGANAAEMNKYTKSTYQGWDGGNYINLPPLVFSVVNDIPYIRWSSNAARPLVQVPLEDPAAASPNHFMGHNGTVYKVNTLFFRN
jgi:uncharacterized surface protein with fasciclin (FAS1) repeats